MATGSGCEHYTRRCSFITPCCNKIYVCRICHDDSEDHQLDRKSVQNIKCLECNNIQEVSSHCEECEVKFGRYYCEICRLYDDQEKGQFHCSDCGICRIGGKKNYFHCPRCDICLGIGLKESHKCVEKSSRSNCPICLDDIHTSRISGNMSPCGHMMHSTCMQQLLGSGSYTCPLCNGSIVDMSRSWAHLDREIENTPMPQEYSNVMVKILCRDCHKESKIKFHVLGHKCTHCGSYNSSREGIEGLPEGVPEEVLDVEDQQPVQEEAAADAPSQGAAGTEEEGEGLQVVHVQRVAVDPSSASVADIRLELDEGNPHCDLPLD